MKTFACIFILFTIAVLDAAERAVYFHNFGEHPYSDRTLRTAFGARHWEVVKTPEGHMLRIRFRIDSDFTYGLLIFDLPSTRMSRFQLRLRAPGSNEHSVPVQLIFGMEDASAVFKGISLEPNSEWTDYTGGIPQDVRVVHSSGNTIPGHTFFSNENGAPVVNKIFLSVRPPPESALLNRDFIIEVQLLECFR